MKNFRYIRDIYQNAVTIDGEYVSGLEMANVDLATGIIRLRVTLMKNTIIRLSVEMTGVEIEGEYQLIHILKEMSQMKKEYMKVQHAIESVRGCGYGVVIPEKDEIELEEPAIIRQGSKFGVKIKSGKPVDSYDQGKYRDRDRSDRGKRTTGERPDRLYQKTVPIRRKESGRLIFLENRSNSWWKMESGRRLHRSAMKAR